MNVDASHQARLRDGLEQLLARPDDPDVLHSVGVGLAHRGIGSLNYEGLDVSSPVDSGEYSGGVGFSDYQKNITLYTV